jgi:SAM-dependent methyltransferase
MAGRCRRRTAQILVSILAWNSVVVAGSSCRHGAAIAGLVVVCTRRSYNPVRAVRDFYPQHHQAQYSRTKGPSRRLTYVIQSKAADCELGVDNNCDSIGANVAFEECWASTSKTANPEKDAGIDTILQGLVSPAPQSFYVLQRAFLKHHCRDEYSSLEEVAERVVSVCSYLLKDGHFLVVRKDHGAGLAICAGVDWNVHLNAGTDVADGWHIIKPSTKGKRTHQMAIDVLSVVSDASDAQIPVNEVEVDKMVQQLDDRLDITVGTDIRGRTCVDTVFTLALAGVTKASLYNRLYAVLLLEMERVHRRPSRKSKDLMHIVEKLAASGAIAADCPDVARIYSIVADSLAQKREYLDTATALSRVTTVESGAYDLLMPRPLLWLWRFSSRLTKANGELSVETSPSTSIFKPWIPSFEDNTKPLVIDLGCGFGVSLLGLASIQGGDPENFSALLPNGTHWSDCNYLGVDLNLLATRFATGITQRWKNIGPERLQFVWLPTEDLLDEVASSYPGPVALILVQFPTPYRLVDDPTMRHWGNTQLPDGDESERFMASPSVLGKIAHLLTTKGNGRLLVQSNCEDVAVKIRDTALQAGFRCVPATQPVVIGDNHGITERTKRWIELSVANNRAIGEEWSSVPLLPPRCATETEVSCRLQDTPVHRCLFHTEECGNFT